MPTSGDLKGDTAKGARYLAERQARFLEREVKLSKHSSYKHRDDGEDTRRRALESKREKETGGRFTPPEGRTTFRILHTPADEERDSPADFMEIQIHRNVGPNHKGARCGNEPGQGQDPRNCWLCHKMARLAKKKRTKEASQLFPGKDLIIQVAVLDKDLGTMVGPLTWQSNSGKTAKALGFKLLNILSNTKSRKWLDHEKGYNFDLIRTGTGKNTVWEVERDDEKTHVSKQILKRLTPFADLSTIFKYNEDYQKQIYYGLEPDKSKGEDMKENKKKKKKDASSSDASSSDASSSDASSSDASSSDASSSDSSSSDSSNKKTKKKKKDSSDASSSDASSSDASSSDSSSSDASSSDASSSDSSSSDSSDEKPKKGKKGKKKKDASSSDASSSDASSSDASSSDASSSDASSSDASSSDASSSDASDNKKKTKRKPRSDKGKARKTKTKKKK